MASSIIIINSTKIINRTTIINSIKIFNSTIIVCSVKRTIIITSNIIIDSL